MTFFQETPAGGGPRKRLDVTLLHRMECKACPLNTVPNEHPHIPPSGSDRPVVYVLGEAPGKTEDEENEQFVGSSGELLRSCIPRDFKPDVRFNNVVRTRPPKNRTPTDIEIECCRPSIVRDIERAKPLAVFGFGNVPLDWVTGGGFGGVTLWRGRKMPVKIGNHTCWYYPMLHPAFLVRQGHGSEEERMFRLDLKRAFAEVDVLPKPVVHTPQDVWRNIEGMTTFGQEGLRLLEEALHWAMKQADVGIDYETDRLRPYDDDARILTAAVANGERGFSFPIDHPEAEWAPHERDRVVNDWKVFLRKTRARKWVHNLAFEHEWTAEYCGPELLRIGRWEDTATQACILDERKGKNKPGCFSLEFLVQQHFGFNLKKLTNLDRKKLASAPLEIVLQYNGGDARYHCLLGLKQEALIKAQGLVAPYELGLRRVPTVVLTQRKGVPVSQPEVKKLQGKYGARLEAAEKEIATMPVVKEFARRFNMPFNPYSNKDVLRVFKDMLNRKECAVVDKWTQEIKYSADESVLEQIKHPLAETLIRLRKANKQKSTYIDPLSAAPKFADVSVLFQSGKLHAVFNTIFSEAGRLSCEWPNLQNFPKRDGEAKEVRKQVVAPPGHVILACDYGQIEARVIAMITRDKAFCKALWEKYDVHQEWAERLARAYPNRVGGTKNLTDKKAMKDFRTDVKNQWTFPLFFGAKLESAAGYLDIPVNVLRPHYNEFWRIFSGVKDWHEELINFYRTNGYVECLTGRRRRGPLSLNQVINSPVQGTAAEIVMDGMCRLSEKNIPELQPNINIHDDLTYCAVAVDRVDVVAEQVISEMLAVPFDWVNVPIAVELSVGDNWMELEEVGSYFSNEWFSDGRSAN